MISTTKYYVIDIYLANKDISIDFAGKQSSIDLSYLKTLFELEILQAIIPISRGLFEPIERLVELVDVVGILGVFKSRWLLYIHQLG